MHSINGTTLATSDHIRVVPLSLMPCHHGSIDHYVVLTVDDKLDMPVQTVTMEYQSFSFDDVVVLI